MLNLEISKKYVKPERPKPDKPIVKEKKVPDDIIKLCNKVQKYNPYTADITFAIPFMLNGLHLMDMSVAILPVFIADIVYRVANITTCTSKILESKETKKKIQQFIKDYKIRNRTKDYIIEYSNKHKLKIDKKAINRRKRYLEFALYDNETKKDFRDKMEQEILDIKEYTVNKNIYKKLKKKIRINTFKNVCEVLKLAGDGVLCSLPLWLYGAIIKMTGTVLDVSYSGTKKFIKKGREKAYNSSKNSTYRKLFNVKKSREEKLKKLSQDIKTINMIAKEIDNEELQERYKEYLKFYGKNLEELLIKNKNKIDQETDLMKKLFIDYAEQNFDIMFMTGETLVEREITGNPVSQVMQRGYLIGLFTKEIGLFKQKIDKLNQDSQRLKEIKSVVKECKNKQEIAFVKYLKARNKHELKYIKKRMLNDVTKISSDMTRFVGGFGLNTVNVVGLGIKILTIFLDIGILTRNSLKNKKEDKCIEKHVEFLNNFCEEIKCSNDAKKEKRMNIYMDVLGDDFSNLKQIQDINNRKDYIRKCLKRDKLY